MCLLRIRNVDSEVVSDNVVTIHEVEEYAHRYTLAWTPAPMLFHPTAPAKARSLRRE